MAGAREEGVRAEELVAATVEGAKEGMTAVARVEAGRVVAEKAAAALEAVVMEERETEADAAETKAAAGTGVVVVEAARVAMREEAGALLALQQESQEGRRGGVAMVEEALEAVVMVEEAHEAGVMVREALEVVVMEAPTEEGMEGVKATSVEAGDREGRLVKGALVAAGAVGAMVEDEEVVAQVMAEAGMEVASLDLGVAEMAEAALAAVSLVMGVQGENGVAVNVEDPLEAVATAEEGKEGAMVASTVASVVVVHTAMVTMVATMAVG